MLFFLDFSPTVILLRSLQYVGDSTKLCQLSTLVSLRYRSKNVVDFFLVAGR